MEDAPDVNERAESGNYIHGLYYEGCGFDKKGTNMVEIARDAFLVTQTSQSKSKFPMARPRRDRRRFYQVLIET